MTEPKEENTQGQAPEAAEPAAPAESAPAAPAAPTTPAAPAATSAPASSPAPSRPEGHHRREGGPRRNGPRGPRRDGPGGRRPRKQYFRKRKVCRFCVERVDHIDYKRADVLQGFVQDRGKVLPRRLTGTCSRHQRWLITAIKRARNIALLPFASEL